VLTEGADPVFQGALTEVYGADLYLKLKPPNQTESYFSLALQAEYILRKVHGASEAPLDGVMYAQIVAQIFRRWYLGARVDVLGIPSSALTPRSTRASGSITFAASEFARLRAYVEGESTGREDLTPRNAFGAYLQLEVSFGAHGAHAF
jgi:hypothetical protein